MPELGQDRVEHNSAIGIILDAQNLQRARRCALGNHDLGIRFRQIRIIDQVDRDAEPERAAFARTAGDNQIAVHGSGDTLDEDQTQASAAEPAGDLRIRLRERPEQSFDLSGLKPDPAVGDGEDQVHTAARYFGPARLQPDAAALRELDCVVDEIFERGPQPQRVADDRGRQIGGDHELACEILGPAARRIDGIAIPLYDVFADAILGKPGPVGRAPKFQAVTFVIREQQLGRTLAGKPVVAQCAVACLDQAGRDLAERRPLAGARSARIRVIALPGPGIPKPQCG